MNTAMPVPTLPRELWEHVFQILVFNTLDKLVIQGPIEPGKDWRHRLLEIVVPAGAAVPRLSSLVLVCRDWKRWLITRMSETVQLGVTLQRCADPIVDIKFIAKRRRPNAPPHAWSDDAVDQIIRICADMMRLELWMAVWWRMDWTSATLAMARARRDFQSCV